MTVFQLLWSRLIIAVWRDSDRTSAAMERWHTALAKRIDEKLGRGK